MLELRELQETVSGTEGEGGGSNLGIFLRGGLLLPRRHRVYAVGRTDITVRRHLHIQSSVVLLVYESGLLCPLGLCCRFLGSLLHGSPRITLLRLEPERK